MSYISSFYHHFRSYGSDDQLTDDQQRTSSVSVVNVKKRFKSVEDNPATKIQEIIASKAGNFLGSSNESLVGGDGKLQTVSSLGETVTTISE